MNQNKPMIIGNIPKLPGKYAAWILPLFLSGLMSGIISFINTVKNLGWIENLFSIFFSAWMMSWLVAYPIILIILPIVKKITGLFVDMSPNQPHK
ncbi:DUF2798 domain-containing protein [Acinetobacter sp. Marseille-Q1618]|uniref:DUF2798 domain-containing protein n=1 Tax=Acinetobacter sp. Marseille-Q1618 TaxID=2697502 RepID=UPI001570403F|nr:DUF2798 domain-containing protein [Acinetobacter sp. Marseille-Q1618]